jgi:hypothetical protein
MFEIIITFITVVTQILRLFKCLIFMLLLNYLLKEILEHDLKYVEIIV